MTRLQPHIARSRIIDILGKSVFQALGLKESLEDERRALETQDLKALDLAVTSKGLCIAELQTLESARATVCVDAGFEPAGMQELTEWCDSDAMIESRWNDLIELATECTSLNLTNGHIIRSRQVQLGSRLAVLRGGTTETTATYERDGSGPAANANRSLAEA